ncbi:LodA/GoxA family CTQ-dependent oxidase [Polyangium aurulentum]|uniref:LodA/GoxA family CTQ-dependent oxidase n=1 Tax=Polyangium aurulentum TaxID=2567896 RepID=UPI0010AE4C3B|nr:LodA/GoxA family CTQ-dependent oxidase [Polyangium aurulentum]UQA56863.1 LodA/GoxA family CTQ-dependent oxidase [Polyangium aurulentum]
MTTEKKDVISPPPCYDCKGDPAARLKQMFVDIGQARRIEKGQCPAQRAVFRNVHGVAYGRFEVRDDLPPELKVGVFAQAKAFETWVRSSSDSDPAGPDLRTTVGIGIKLFGVEGEKLLEQGDTQDFILQNHDVFFVDDAEEMCEFTYAGVVAGDYPSYLRTHPKTARVFDEMAKVEGSVLTATYWSGLPFKLGEGRYVKYKLVPDTRPENVPNDVANYMAIDMAVRLRQRAYTFKFYVQLFVDDDKTPLDKATVRWSEADSEPIHVATLTLFQQDIEARGQAAYGDNLAFNIWHALPTHEPVGSIALVRKSVYAASAEARRTANGVPLQEPGEPRRPALPISPTAPREPTGKDRCIVRAAIHPSIGVARVGNSHAEGEHGYYIGPEVPDPPAPAPGYHRDRDGRLKRQAARFRIYGLDSEGNVVAELTPDNAEIRWTVHLANKKSAWYQFQLALDIPEAASVPPSGLRNAEVANRADLVIDPGSLSIDARERGGDEYRFDRGRFMGTPVYLGELRTDERGHLIVLGGRGHAAAHNGARAVTFANNEGWHDDISDGPVTAEVHYEGRMLDVDPAWVVVAPPNYAPMQKSVRTMYDLIRDVAIQAGQLPKPRRPSFDRDIRPILERLSRLQWVNAGFAAAFGWKGPFDLASPEWLERLSRPSAADRATRHMLANQFRALDRDGAAPSPWPWLYGDAMNVPPAATPRQNCALTDTQIEMLGQWAMGDFDADYDPNRTPPRSIDEVPLADQPATLDRASLDFCLADAFHPGCEMTWPMRHASLYMPRSPFRIQHATDPVEPSFGGILSSDTALSRSGPLGGQYPGGLTRWMAVPWHTDSASCRSGYSKTYDPYLPTFWPARVPNQVLTRQSYEIVKDTSKPLDERMAAFANRATWLRPIIEQPPEVYEATINTMIEHFDYLSVVEPAEGPPDRENFPAYMEVEDRHDEPDVYDPDASRTNKALASVREAVTGTRPQPAATSPASDLGAIDKVRRFPFGLR